MAETDEDPEHELRETLRKAELDAFRRALPITVAELQELVTVVWDLVQEQGCDHTMRFARQWAADHRIGWRRLESALKFQGGYCDCEVCYNCDPGVLFG